MRYLDKFETIWSINDILSSYVASISFYMCLIVIIWTLMMNSVTKNTNKVFLMKIFLKSIEIWNTLDKFETIWSIYGILSSYAASFSFYMCLVVIIWTLIMNSVRKNTYTVFLMKIFLKSIEIWNTWTNLKQYDQFMTSWAVMQLRSASTCVSE